MPPRDPPIPPWPTISEDYIDEKGWIDAEVHNVAGAVWRIAEKLAEGVIHDPGAAQSLMMKAIAIVSRKRQEDPARLTNIKGYLFETFRHLLIEEREKRDRREQIDMRLVLDSESVSQKPEDELVQMILFYEVRDRADQWTRKVLELRALGYSFEEIARELHVRSNYVRSRFGKRVSSLITQVRQEMATAELRVLQHKQRDRSK